MTAPSDPGGDRGRGRHGKGDRRRGREGNRGRTLPDVTEDERETGWGDDLAAENERRDADWYRRQRPPHHE